MPREMLSHQDIAKMIDVSAVQTPHGEQEIRELVACAKAYRFGCVHVLPAWVAFARTLLGEGGEIALGAPVGFPSGGNHAKTKITEALQVVADGVDELDAMINVGKLLSGDHAYVMADIRGIVDAVSVPVKVILETHYLTEEDIRAACELCIEAGARYVKTSTGWAPTGASLENIALITSCVRGRVGVKAAGGIRDLDTLIAMYRMGVRRFGVNRQAAMEIVDMCRRLPDGRVEVES